MAISLHSNINTQAEPYFKDRGVLFDITRGRVPKPDYLKEVIRLLADYGINHVQLYMEHTFAYSFFGSVNEKRDGYTAEDIKGLDDFCHSLGVELVPCIATFGHMYEVLQSKEFSHLCELDPFDKPVYSWMDRQLHHTIDISNPESLDLIRRMVAEISSCYRSPYLNICGDETYDIGKGKSSELVKELGQTEAYIDFLNKIMDIVYDHGKIPMYWGDVILKHPDQIGHINNGAMPMHWWYEEDVSESDFLVLEKLERPYYTCPAAVGWNHFINHYERSMINIDKMLGYGKKHGAAGALITDWGDFGHINHLSSSVPMYVYGAIRAIDPDRDMTDWYIDLMPKAYYDLLVDAGNERLITFEFLMKWYYDHYNDDQAYGDIKAEVLSMPMSDLVKSEETINLLIKRLDNIGDIELHPLVVDKSTLRHNLEGAKWMVQFVMCLKDDESPYKSTLPQTLKEWYNTYEVIWQMYNRDSELYRFKEVLDNIAAYLNN